MNPTDLKPGRLGMLAPGGRHRLHCVQFAYDDTGAVFVAGVAGPQTAIKSFAAALNENVRLELKPSGFNVIDGDGDTVSVPQSRDYSRVPGGQGKYKCHMHRLPYNTVHCVAFAKDRRLMTTTTEAALWDKFRSNLFTTPLLRAWMPWLRARLIEDGRLKMLSAFGCAPGLLNASDEILDALVTEGVRAGKLTIRKEDACNSC